MRDGTAVLGGGRTAQARSFTLEFVGFPRKRLCFITRRRSHIGADLEVLEDRPSVAELGEADFAFGNVDFLSVNQEMLIDVTRQTVLLDADFEVVPVARAVMLAWGCLEDVPGKNVRALEVGQAKLSGSGIKPKM